MWQVGDAATHAAFLAALASTHTRTTVATAYRSGVAVADLALTAGEVRVTGASQVRRRATLTLPESSWVDYLSPYGPEIRVWSIISTGTVTFPRVPLFTGRIERRSRVRRSGSVVLECWDRFAAINDDSFEAPRAAPAGSRISDAIAQLILETHPTSNVAITATAQSLVPVGLTWDAGDGSRGQAIDKMALAIGAEVVALPDGSFLVRDYPTMSGAVAWGVGIGSAGVVVQDVLNQARSGVANRWIITGNQSAASASVRTVASIDSGPFAYGGVYGRVVRTYTDPMITSADQATRAGNAILARVQGMAQQREVTTVANPAVEGGDVLQVTTEDGISLHLADSFAVPVGVDNVTMAIASRSTNT